MSQLKNLIICLVLVLSFGPARARSEVLDGSYKEWLKELNIETREDLPSEAGFSDYLSVLLSNNPELRTLYYRWQAAEEKVAIVNAWPDPQIKAGIAIQPVVTAQGPQDLRLGLSQVIPRVKERRASTQVQVHLSEATQAQLNSRINDLSLELKQVYADLYLLGQQLSIQNQVLLLLRNWQEVLLTRYRSARADHPDLVKTQLEVLRLEDQIQNTEVLLENTEDELRRLLHLDSRSSLIAPANLDAGKKLLLAREPLETVSENPRLTMERSYREAARKAEAVAISRTRPQLVLGLDWIVTGNSDLVNPALDAGGDAISLSVGFSLPVWGGKNKAVKASARAELVAHESKYEAINHELLVTTSQATRDLKNAERRIALLEDSLIPKSQEAYNVLETAYTAGNADLLSLLDAVEDLLDQQLQLVKANVTLWRAQARLDHLKGIVL
ncbi:MAG: TolC family protein [Candidatus Marinimicrobia bacterium]|nr:TolC family protein [Candidatus Neomarinimicrobiota bacterium]MCF7851576.1 TolC family protein [Candidatus Neomarinimicrobiota bacterium]